MQEQLIFLARLPSKNTSIFLAQLPHKNNYFHLIGCFCILFLQKKRVIYIKSYIEETSQSIILELPTFARKNFTSICFL